MKFVYSIHKIKPKTNIVPSFIGIPNSIFKAIAPPRSSARAVDIAAITAEPSTTLFSFGFNVAVDASDKQLPVTIPR